MPARLRAKPGGDAVGVTTGDFATTRVPGTFTLVCLVCLVCNTVDNLTTQDAQVDLMARLAGRRLRDRWEDWDGTPVTHEGRRHVSVREKPAG